VKGLILLLFLLPGIARADGVEQAAAAVAAAPDRPGLRLALAEQLIEAHRWAEAEAEARWVLARWPQSSRARLVLARVARGRGQTAEANALLAEVERMGSQMARAEARAQRVGPSGGLRWSAWGRFGARYDTRASVPDLEASPPVLEGGPALRGQAGLGVACALGASAVSLGVERTLHLATEDDTDAEVHVADLDRTTLWMEGRTAWGGPNRLTLSVLGRGIFNGRTAEPGLGGGGLGLGWRHTQGSMRPRAQARGLVLKQAEGDALGWADAEVGTEALAGPMVLDVEARGTWLGPDVVGGREVEGNLEVRGHRRLAPFAQVGLGQRDDGRGLRPRAVAGLRVATDLPFAVVLEGGWQRVEARNRALMGVTLEVWQ